MPQEENPLLFGRVSIRLPRGILRSFALRLRQEVADGRSFCCLLTDDGELRRMNRSFLGKDYATDVLSFPSAMTDGDRLGDIAISVDRAVEQARVYGHALEQELGILMLHGVLHLLGMDHEKDRGRMARAEARWRKKLGLPAGLIERVRT